jgi:hypothetical protein
VTHAAISQEPGNFQLISQPTPALCMLKLLLKSQTSSQCDQMSSQCAIFVGNINGELNASFVQELLKERFKQYGKVGRCGVTESRAELACAPRKFTTFSGSAYSSAAGASAALLHRS